MASAWGFSFGASWGDSFGQIGSASIRYKVTYPRDADVFFRPYDLIDFRAIGSAGRPSEDAGQRQSAQTARRVKSTATRPRPASAGRHATTGIRTK